MSERCVRCGVDLRDGVRTCPLCGARQAGRPFRPTAWQVMWAVVGIELLVILWLALK